MAFSRKPIAPPDKVTRFSLFALATFFFLTTLIVFSATVASAATPAEEGKTIFEQKCQGCHTIGGGRGVGPDLKGITSNRESAWLIRFIMTPEKLIAEGDPIARQIVQEYGGLPMPNLGVTEAEAKAILAYLETKSAASQPAPAPQPTVTTTTLPLTPTARSVDSDTGRDLFTGKLAFKNGGPSCLSCHNVNSVGLIGGGTVGKDLTNSYSLFGETGISSLLKTTPFPMMKEIYTAKPLTDHEIAAVTAFLKAASSAPAGQSQNPSLFIIIGVVSAVIIIGIFQLLWRGRLSGVRRSLVKGGSR